MAATCLRAFARLVLMSTNRPRRPGAPNQGPWEAMARELSSDPDSPASLRIMSAVNSALRPRAQAVDQLVDALADQEQQPGASADAAVAAALAHWRAACGVSDAEADLQSLREQARERVDRRKRQPPALESIVEGVRDLPDAGYALGVSLHGLRGTWHRLWAALSLSKSWGDLDADVVRVVRLQFEQALGRSLSADEWTKLDEHAAHHAATVMKPMVDGVD
jgi:phosphoglycolate phosphatase-like HAD superfamily hydrolase